ncbi:hypothetical protein KUTeg_014204 [Tegillarca granosa]|uniref:ADP-dependent glucokinase n=1 Tax=Tegillarca granosa TaxID=220873 RepID=A0ABQ9F144_TEGGR|nr:hypothetical protein KUTeg_014204 [Tegillarca granosa]
MFTKLTAGSVLSISVVILAYLYYKDDPDIDNRLDQVLSGLLRAEKKLAIAKPRIALGFGGCEDLVVNALNLFNKMGIEPPENPKHFDSVHSEEELAQLLAYFFQHGAAAERYVSNDTLFSALTKMADTLPEKKYFLGGNAPVMARRLANEGAEVLLGAKFTKQLRNTLPETVKVVGGEPEEDDIHLLMEYDIGDKWGKYKSPRANRLIVHSDNSNPYIDTLEDLEKEIKDFKPSVLVVGGLQMMDNFPFKEGFRQERLAKLRNLLTSTPRTTKIHFELASFTDHTLFQEIIDNVLLYSDSLGMNEQELPNLVSMLVHGNISLVADSQPRIASVLDQLRTVYSILKKTREVDRKRKITRLHLHTLAYQAILTTKGSQWKNSMSAAAKASLTAHRYICGSQYINLMKARLIMDDSFTTTAAAQHSQRIPLQENRPVSCWDEDDYEICLAPVLVCTEVIKTGGGGDNVSSAGLLAQVNSMF